MSAAATDRRMSPPRHELDALRTPLREGERRILDLLDAKLPPAWDIYIQPHLNGCRPDFVLLSQACGVALLEVKEWASIDPIALATALDRLRLYESEIEELYCPALSARVGSLANVSARLVLTSITRSRLDAAAPALSTEQIVCGDELKMKRLVPVAFREPCHLDAEAMADLRSWLDEPRCAREQRMPLFRELSVKQRALVGDPTAASRLRRIKGSAGAGKSLVLAARAAHLAKFEGKRGLVTSFNVTLLHYLRDLAVRYPVPERNALVNEYVTWIHFHAWCKRICIEAGLGDRYRALFTAAPLERVMSDLLPELTIEALVIRNPRYDFILVDEGQDWQLGWWKTLQCALADGGEMMLVADRTQDVYGNRKKWTDEAMSGAGFRGAWTSLDESYRLPAPLLPRLQTFATSFIRDDVHLPSAPQLELQRFATEWINVEKGSEGEACLAAARRLQSGQMLGDRVAPPDIVLLVQTREAGTACVEALQRGGYSVCHTFARDGRAERRLKHAFFRGDARIKATTYQSYKGFENSAVIVVVTRAEAEYDFRGIYAALTRVKRDAAGSALIVINSADALRAYGAGW